MNFLPRLSVVVVFRVLRAGKQDIESQMGFGSHHERTGRPTALHTASAIAGKQREGGGRGGLREEVYLLSTIGVGAFVWRFSEAGVILRDRAARRATLRRCRGDKAATRGRILDTDQRISIFPSFSHALTLLHLHETGSHLTEEDFSTRRMDRTMRSRKGRIRDRSDGNGSDCVMLY